MRAQPQSEFAAGYAAGMPKTKYWEPVYEDSLNLIAKLPAIAALIYRNTYRGGDVIEPDSRLDWAANLAHMMGACRLESIASIDELTVEGARQLPRLGRRPGAQDGCALSE